MEELYKKVCKFFAENTIDAELKETKKVIFTVNNVKDEFDSYEQMYKALDIEEALYNDYEEEPELLEEYGITQQDLIKLKVL